MKVKQIALTLTVAVGTLGLATQGMAAQGPPPGYYQGQQGGWDAPPNEYQQDVQRRGFHDGVEGARKDYENHRPPNVDNRDEYRHPDVPHGERRAYRDAFRRGYQVGVDHLMHDHDRDHDHY